MNSKTVYRITFTQLDSIYEIYARKIAESDLFGFLEVEELVFDTHSSLVVDPSEEKLKLEFSGVNRTYIPMHAVHRIDEVDKVGEVKVRQNPSSSGSVSVFPIKNK
jgi:hypothetical protein